MSRSLHSVRATRPVSLRAMLEIEINSSLPGLHVRAARGELTQVRREARERKIAILLTREHADYCSTSRAITIIPCRFAFDVSGFRRPL